MSFYLSSVNLHLAWMPFFDMLPGWKEVRKGELVGSGARVHLHDKDGPEIQLCAVTAEGPRHEVLADMNRLVVHDAAKTSLKPPKVDTKIATLNHLAFDLPEHDQNLARLFRKLDPEVFLPPKERFDPSVEQEVKAEHLIGEDGCYLTLRHLPQEEQAKLSHIGFRLDSEEAFETHYALLQELGWPIEVDAQVVDGSLLTHFRSPDGMVNDIFYVLER